MAQAIVPALISFAGSLLVNALFPAKIEGPRQTEVRNMTARTGVPIPWGDGIFRVPGTLMACQPGDATEHKKKKRQGKGGGPTVTTYTYTRTHAVLICEGPIVGIRRIWRNQKLVYDATALPTSADEPDPDTLIEKLKAAIKSKASTKKFAENLTIYLGDEDQMPDPALEALFGVNEVSAFRGIAYMVVEDDDVTEFGKAIPQYEFEVARAGEIISDEPAATLVAHWKLSDADTGTALDSSGNTLDGSYVGTYLDAAAISTSSGGSMETTATDGGVAVPTDALLDVGDSTNARWSIGITVRLDDDTPVSEAHVLMANWGSLTGFGRADWAMTLLSQGGLDTPRLSAFFNETVSFVNRTVSDPDPLVVGTTYRVWAVRDEDELRLYKNGELVATATCGSAASCGGGLGVKIGSGNFYPSTNGFIGALSDAMVYDGALTQQDIDLDFARFLPASNYTEYDLPDVPGWRIGSDGTINYNGQPLPESVAQDTVYASDFIAAACTRAGLRSDMYDVTGIAGVPLIGYVVKSAIDAHEAIQPLLDALFITVYEADGKLWFVPKGGGDSFALTEDDLVAVGDGPPVAELRAQEVEIPRRFVVKYQDPATAYTETTQASERTTSDVTSVGERVIDLSGVVMDADQAAQAAHKIEKAAWVGLLGGKEFAIPDQFSAITPTDCGTLTYRGRTERVCVDRQDAENGVLKLTTLQDRQSAYSSDRTGTSPDDFYYSSAIVGPTLWNVLLLPQLRPQDVGPGVYFACTGLVAGWRGCELQMSVDSGTSWLTLGQYDSPNLMGYLEAAITNADTTARVVMLGSNELESVTTAQVAAGSNRAVIVTSADVAEVVNFEDATLDTGTTYDVATMDRSGLLGTTPASHSANERFIQLDGINFVPIPLEYEGDTILFRAVSLGTLESNNGEQSLTFLPPEILIDGGGA